MAMLVDYATSDDDDDPALSPRSSPVTVPAPSTTPIAAPPVPPPSVLPSAAQLFSTPSSSATTSNSSALPRKRPQVNGSSHPGHAPKVPRANSSSVRTASSATLVPPQLRGSSQSGTPLSAALPALFPLLPLLRLPSAAQFFASTSNSSSLPRKRPQVNGSSHPSHAPNVPCASSSSVRTASSATLVPPQLRGRGNMATEDLDKLFVHRHQRKPE